MTNKYTNTTWTEETIAILKKLCANRPHSAPVIAAFRKRYPGQKWTKGMIVGKAHRLGLHFHDLAVAPPTPDQERIIRAMIAENRSDSAIGKKFGWEHGRIMRLRKAWNLPKFEARKCRVSLPVIVEDPPMLPRPPVVGVPLLEVPPAVELPPVIFEAPAHTATVFHFPAAGRCCFLTGERRSYRQCEAMAVSGPDVPRPHSYCAEHRAVAYAKRKDVAA